MTEKGWQGYVLTCLHKTVSWYASRKMAILQTNKLFYLIHDLNMYKIIY